MWIWRRGWGLGGEVCGRVIERRIRQREADAGRANERVEFGDSDNDVIDDRAEVVGHGELQDVAFAKQADELVEGIGQSGGRWSE